MTPCRTSRSTRRASGRRSDGRRRKGRRQGPDRQILHDGPLRALPRGRGQAAPDRHQGEGRLDGRTGRRGRRSICATARCSAGRPRKAGSRASWTGRTARSANRSTPAWPSGGTRRPRPCPDTAASRRRVLSGEGGDNYDGFYWTANTPFIPAVAFEVTRFSRGWQDSLRAVPEEGNGWIRTEWDDIRIGVTLSNDPLVWGSGQISGARVLNAWFPDTPYTVRRTDPWGSGTPSTTLRTNSNPSGAAPLIDAGVQFTAVRGPYDVDIAPCGRDLLDQHQRPRSQHGSGIPEHARPVLPVRDRVGRSLEHADHARQPEPVPLQLHGRIHRMGASLARPGRPGRWRRRRRGSLGERRST